MMEHEDINLVSCVIKQCNHLLPYDSSIFTIIGALSNASSTIIEDINRRNKGETREYEMDLEINALDDKETLISEVDYKKLRQFIQSSTKTKDFILFHDSSGYAVSIMTTLILLCIDEEKNPNIIVSSHDDKKDNIATYSELGANIIFSTIAKENMYNYELSMSYNHVVSTIAHEGLGGGLTSPAAYDTLNGILSQETYDQHVLDGCVDDRKIGSLWTPWYQMTEKM